MQNLSYQFQPSAQLTSKLAAIDTALADIQRLRAQKPDRWLLMDTQQVILAALR